MHLYIHRGERPDLPAAIEPNIEFTHDLSKLPVGPMNTDWIGFVPAGYQNPLPQKPLPRDVALPLIEEWHPWPIIGPVR